MASRITDRWLWLGLGVFTFFAVKGVAYGLREVVKLTEVTKKPPDPVKLPPTASEDAIKTDSLATLATCSNIEIRKAATRLICDRFMRSPTARKLLMDDLNSPDTERREAGMKALRLLDVNGLLDDALATDMPGVGHGHGHSPFQNISWRGARARAHGESRAEQELRRRRREAIVINEGDRPVSQDDIIQPQTSRWDDEGQTNGVMWSEHGDERRADEVLERGHVSEDEEAEEVISELIEGD